MKLTAALGLRLMALSAAMTGANALISPLHAQNDGTERLTDVRARAAIQLVIKNTNAKHLPIDPLIRKVREGVAKQSEPARIEVAVQLLAKRLETAAAALVPVFSVEELSAGADALQAGVPAETLRDLRKVWVSKPLTVPLGILYELVSREVSVTQATKRVRELMQKGANDAQLATMSTRVVADVDAGLTPDAALELRTRGVISLLSSTPQGTVPTSAAPPKPPIRPK
ncbi:MAG: hypothetical protein ABJB74_00255 [Gemmatimonas sp.]